MAMQREKTLIKGLEISQANKALIMLHGRGGRAEDILAISSSFCLTDFAIFAPQAPGNTWYPYSFLEPEENNEPYLSASLETVRLLVQDITLNGIGSERIYLLGFSQGACLVSEFLARNAKRFGGAAIFTGGLIGKEIDRSRYKGDLGNTPVFLGAGDPDFHVPVTRVKETTAIFRSMGANVTEKLYPGMGHTISSDEIRMANTLIFPLD